MTRTPYNREAAVAYAHQWAMARNPRYYDFSNLGGDCTNFVSQCLYAGSGIMNYARPLGWFYISTNNRSASWTGVQYLYNFLIRPSGVGPIGQESSILDVQPGDVSQFAATPARFTHTQIIVSVGDPPTLENILVNTHTYDSQSRPLSTYTFDRVRFIHIEGVNR